MASPNYNALSASDGSGEPVLATVEATRAVSSTSITVDATTHWPTGTFIATTGTLLSTGKLDPTTVQVFYGTASGTTITITAFAAGYSDLGSAINDVVVVKPTTEWANIVSQGLQSTTQFPAQFANFVEPGGGVWTTSTGLLGSQTAGHVWYAGVRSVIPTVTTHTFTASKDTYVDFNSSTSAFTYVPVTNGAAEPAVTASNVRVAKIVTSGSAVTTISQQAYQKAVPLVWKYLGLTQITSNFSTTNTTATQITGLTITVTIPAGTALVRVTAFARDFYNQTTAQSSQCSIWVGTVGSGTQIGATLMNGANGTATPCIAIGYQQAPAAGSVTYNVGLNTSLGTANLEAGSTYPASIQVEVC